MGVERVWPEVYDALALLAFEQTSEPKKDRTLLDGYESRALVRLANLQARMTRNS